MSSLINHNVWGAGKRTSMRLEPEVWDALREICLREDISSEELVSRAVRSHPSGGRTSAVRVFILMYYRVAHHVSAGSAASGKAEADQDGGRPVEMGHLEGGNLNR
jgi:predicted DNA-binding ribbon-helix-helix protein